MRCYRCGTKGRYYKNGSLGNGKRRYRCKACNKDFLENPRRRQSDEERFWSKVTENDNGCWIWQGTKTGGGYGNFGIQTGTNSDEHHGWTTIHAHRWAWQQQHGAIPEDLELHHTCGNKACVRPDHLRLVTRQQHSNAEHATYCRNGHPRTEENTLWDSSGYRRCRICYQNHLNKRKRQRRQRGLQKGGAKPKTHCKRGHAFTEENTSYDRDGYKVCKACNREYARRKKRRPSISS